MRLRPLVLAALLAALLPACQRDADAPVASAAAPLPPLPELPLESEPERRIEADVRILADDDMQGRETGTPGYDRAAEYVAARYARIGLEPAGDDGGYYQPVPLIRTLRREEGAQLVVDRNGREIELRFGDQFLHMTDPLVDETSLEAPAVFVGQAIHAPELGHDDFAGVDLHGKIAVMLPDAPESFPIDMRAFHSTTQEKRRAIIERGAVGAVIVFTPDFEARIPWQYLQTRWQSPSMALVAPDGSIVDGTPELRAGAMVPAAAGDLIFADHELTFAQLIAAYKRGDAAPFDLPGTLRIAGRSRSERLTSNNVVGKLPGSDPALAAEHVVYTAHLDHIGLGEAVDGDSIHNGALDNALGVAIMLEAAQILVDAGTAPGRSSLFIALTAEEQGLLGAHWFAQYPSVPRGSLVANINMDMPVLTAPTTDVVPVGVEHSSLKQVLERAAAEIGVALSDDPFPEEVIFVRSDQYAFVRAGIPAVYLNNGIVGTNEEQDPKVAFTWFLRNCYHKPCDDLDLPIHYSDAVRLARLNARIGQVIGDAEERPTWNEGNFFGEKFGPAAQGSADIEA